jgi:two-component system heavy metal sensor histidine kinase CusS
MFLAGGLTLLAAGYGIHQGHAPLRKLSASLSEIQAEHLDMRLNEATVPTELVSLVVSFNQMLSRLEDSFLKLSHFSADIAHELRTPLTNLITQTQVALGKSRSLEEYRELLYSNLEEQERLTKMVNDMLWLAQSENGLLKPDFECLNLVDEVQAIFEFFEALAEEKHLRLQVEGSKARVLGDKAMLRRALSNLLSNAIRYTPEGEQIQVLIKEYAGEACLTVENPGPQIAPEHLPRLFERFYRVDPSRQRQTEGAGLGLAIVKSIIELHDGSIQVSSEHGLTRFKIYLPAVRQNSAN